MSYGASAFAFALAFLLSFVERASAHGPPPAATELLARDGQGVTLVRLTPGGLAQRVADGFRFVCPEAWGGDVLAPAAAIPFGPALIASGQLYVVEPDGRSWPHPIQTGAGIAVTSHGDAVFGVFKHDGQYELRRITQGTNDLVRVLDQPFGALVANDRELSLLRWLDSTLVLQSIAFTGELRASVTWSVPNGVAYARLRAVGDALYVVVWGRSAPWVTLGRVTERGYEPMREASTDIAGPVALAAETLVALDGKLQMLESGATLDTRGKHVTCLGAVDVRGSAREQGDDGQPYVCADGDLLRVDPSGLGAPLFELDSLREPDYETLPAGARLDCTTRWLDLQNDVAVSMASSADAADGSAGTAPPDAAERAPGTAKPTGCSLGTGTEPTRSLCVIFVVGFAAWRRNKMRD